MVGTTRLELATSRPPAVRATNCATSRYFATKSPEHVLSTFDIPRKVQRWVLSNHFHGNDSFELPIKYDIQENHIRLDSNSGTFLLYHFSAGQSPKMRPKTSKMKFIEVRIKALISGLAASTIIKTNIIPNRSIASIPRRTNSGAKA